MLIQPDGDTDGCALSVKAYTQGLPSEEIADFVVLVERGNCSFYTKVQQAYAVGARGIIVYNSVKGMYQGEATAPENDYECGNGASWVSSPYSPSWMNDPPSCGSDSRCASHHCLMTNETSSLGQKACCAWDLYITMGATISVEIEAVYITMSDADSLLSNPSLSSHTLRVRLYSRYEPWMDMSSVFLWLLAVSTVCTAAVYASRDLSKQRHGYSPVRPSPSSAHAADYHTALEINTSQTVGFIALASCVLILMFYVNLYALIAVLYTVSATAALSTVLTTPAISWLLSSLCSVPEGFQFNVTIPYFGNIHVGAAGFFGTPLAGAVALYWYFNRGESWAWMCQDLLGACVCVLFLSLVHFPSARVATSLLCLAFIYDIFFVFISPYFFSESVMVKVATGGHEDVDEDFCEKYPNDSKCDDTTMPMLLLMPRIGGYLGGYSLLGLGDVILPGLLVVFCRRYDLASGYEATAHIPTLLRSKFILMILGYAVGLMCADIAVCATGQGQPALLYIVPCTLGLLVCVSYRDGTLDDLWRGPRCLRAHGEVQRESRSELGQEDDDTVMIALGQPGANSDD